MIKLVLRNLAAVILALVVLFTLLMIVEVFSAVVHPFPEGFKGTMEETCAHVERYPQWVLAVVVPMWAVASFATTWVAQRVGSLYAAGIVGALTIAGLLYNVTKLPYPIWFKVVCLVVVPLALVAGSRLARRPRLIATSSAGAQPLESTI